MSAAALPADAAVLDAAEQAAWSLTRLRFRGRVPGRHVGDRRAVVVAKGIPVSLWRGRLDDALEFYDQVLEVAENGVWIGNMRARVLRGIGFVHTQHGRRCEALDLQTQALSIARNYGSRILQVAILNDLAGTHAAAARQPTRAITTAKPSPSPTNSPGGDPLVPDCAKSWHGHTTGWPASRDAMAGQLRRATRARLTSSTRLPVDAVRARLS